MCALHTTERRNPLGPLWTSRCVSNQSRSPMEDQRGNKAYVGRYALCRVWKIGRKKKIIKKLPSVSVLSLLSSLLLFTVLFRVSECSVFDISAGPQHTVYRYSQNLLGSSNAINEHHSRVLPTRNWALYYYAGRCWIFLVVFEQNFYFYLSIQFGRSTMCYTLQGVQ